MKVTPWVACRFFLGSEGGSSKEEVTKERETKEEEEPGWARLWEFEYDNILIVLFSCNYVLVYTYIWLV